MPRRWTILAVMLALAVSLPILGHLDQRAQAVNPASGDPVLLAAGDVAQCDALGDEATAELVKANLGANGSVALLGDAAYPVGDGTNYANCYNPTWGQFKAQTHPATGNHDYEGTTLNQAQGYFDYWGAAAGPRPQGYYSYDLGAWHIIVLNSTCGSQGGSGLDGCNANSSMGKWLQADLAATQAKCMVAYWHHPRFYSMSLEPGGTLKAGQGASQDVKLDAIWGLLQNAGVDVVLSGHRHVYERMAKMKASGAKGTGVPDPAGIRSFVVGTGGGPHESFVSSEIDPNSEKRIEGTWGALRLTLHDTSYDWQFLSAGTPGTTEPAAGTVLDSGSDPCRTDIPPTSATSTPDTTATTSTPTTTAPSPTPTGTRSGYWMVGADGKVYNFGEAAALGDASGLSPGAEAVDLEPTPSGNGYWVVDSSGKVQSFGNAVSHGALVSSALASGERVTSLSGTPTGAGYWIFTTRGRVLAFGDAVGYGDMSATRLNGPVLDSIPTPSGRGYYMVASDGGIFAFGDAKFYGSMGGTRLNAPVQSLVPDADGKGYWLVASDGGIFAFDAPFKGSMGDKRLNKPVTGMVRYADGYLMVGEDGGIFNFSGKQFLGSLGGHPPARPIVSVAVLG